MKGKGKKEKEKDSTDSDDNTCPLKFLDFKPIDHMRQCPRFTTIVQRTEDENIGSEDLDVLQLELETLLVSVVKRQRLLQTEMEALVNWHDIKNRDKRSPNKPVPTEVGVIGKRSKQSDDKPTKKFKDNHAISGSSGGKMQSTSRPQKAKNKTAKLVESDYSEHQQKAVSKKTIVKNDIPNQFWSFIEPYCCEITSEHIKDLSEQIKSYDNDSEFFKTPNLGKHYSLKWEDNQILESKSKKKGLSASNCSSGSSPNSKQKKTTKNCHSEGDKTSFGALTQRLVSCLIEENLLNGGPVDCKTTSNEMLDSKGTNGSPNHKVFKSLNLGNTAQLERRIRKELEEHGIISLDDILSGTDSNNTGDEDEILDELKRCQLELKALTSKNQSQLKRLLGLAKKEMTRQEVKQKLQMVDAEVVEAYRRICSAKQKKRSPSKKERESARKALKERDQLVRQLQTLS